MTHLTPKSFEGYFDELLADMTGWPVGTTAHGRTLTRPGRFIGDGQHTYLAVFGVPGHAVTTSVVLSGDMYRDIAEMDRARQMLGRVTGA